MENYIYDNGEFIPKDHSVLLIDNRGFRYGDGLFETMRMCDGKIPLLDEHLKRLNEGLKLLQIIPPYAILPQSIKDITGKLSILNQAKNARFRLSVYREGKGRYLPEEHNAGVLVECEALGDAEFSLNKKGLHIGYYADIPKVATALSPFKTSNALPYVLASIYSQNQGWDDCLVLNQYGRIADALYSNVMIVKDNKMYTPPTSEGGVRGVMCETLKKVLESNEFFVEEKSLEVTDLFQAHEVLLTNASSGIRWVKSFGEHRYDNIMAQFLVNRLNEYLFK